MTDAAATDHERQPVLFLPHGGGPCFFMDWAGWDKMEAYLRGVAATLPRKPSAILVVSGHWETREPTVTTAENHSLLYDYYGFPDHTYHLKYPAPGSPALAARVRSLLTLAGIRSAEDDSRGLDHGVFIPFMLAFPDADIPVVELSLHEDMNAAEELRVGHALAPLRDENVLIVATGMSYHNLRQFMTGDPATDAMARLFDRWLSQTVEASPADRHQALTNWEHAPGARICHPREEHLLPLMIAAGAAGQDRGVRTYSDVVMGKALSGFRFG
ncbi:MAG: class III extradiol ring-cleavage dioxygenase [Acetobacter aceti]|uniref:Dioxygenase n=1 Tax=Acetobacter aceti TaxID=435 RepID=A0A1U9KKI9_ACEAC|nr:class III extradiol ring-cleavage dioxygenase [Acetobacter aceti]AQS86285.1 dioxygenase [Acetobacter aceti]